jgi:hypothetical protein
MYILAGFLALGFLCNLLVRPVADKVFMTDEELAKEKHLSHDRTVPAADENSAVIPGVTTTTHPVVVITAWAAVGIPLAYGLWNTVQKAVMLFK